MILFIIISLYGILHLSSVQTWITKKVCNKLSKELNTNISIGKIDYTFFNKLTIENLLIEDQSKDSLFFSGKTSLELNDWFFLKDSLLIQQISLSDFSIKLKRYDSVWNYDFLENYLEHPSSNKKSGSGGNIKFSCKKIELNNFKFEQIDEWSGEDILFSLQKTKASFKKIDVQQQIISLDELELNSPSFARKDYKGKKPSISSNNKKTKTPSEKNEWTVSANNIHINNGSVKNDKETERLPFDNQFDGLHLLFHSINANLKNVSLQEDTLTADIQMATKERSGFEVKSITAKFRFTPEIMEFNQLNLVTNKSKIRNYYAMKYHSFNDDMNDFINKVNLTGRFDSTTVCSDDIAYFAPELKNFKRIINLSGNANGTIDQLHTDKLVIASGKTIITGSADFQHLDEINDLFIDFNTASSHTTFNEIAQFVPSIKGIHSPDISKLGSIDLKGRYYGTIRNFKWSGIIQTDIGDVDASVKMNIPEKGVPQYNGNVSANKFQLGSFINNKNIGNISLQGDINGKGFNVNSLQSNFVGFVSNFSLNHYNYQNININGSIENKKFRGHLDIDDPNLKISDLNGSAVLNGDDIELKILSKLDYSNFKNLKLTDKDISLTGMFDLNFTGNSIDNFLGSAQVSNATLYSANKTLHFDSLILSSKIENENKILTLQSNEINADIAGKFKIIELPDAFNVFLHKYYPNYINNPTNKLSDQDFSFHINTKNIEDYLKIYDSKLTGGNNAEITGKLNMQKNKLGIHAYFPKIGYDKNIVSDLIIDESGDMDTLHTNITVGDLQILDSFHIPNTRLSVNSSNDNSEISLKTSTIQSFNDAELNANLTTLTDGIKLHFSPSSFFINDKKWILEKDGELILRKNFIHANDIKFTQDSQSVLLYSELDDLTDKQKLTIEVSQFKLDDFIPLAFKNPSIKGILSGKAIIDNPSYTPKIEFYGRADSLSLEDKKVGNVNIFADANTSNGDIHFKAENIDSTNIFSLNGLYNYKDSGNTLQADLQSKTIQLSILEPYLDGIFDQINGTATTNLQLTGGNDHQFLNGTVHVNSGSFKIGYTKCRYLLDNQTIQFTDDAIRFDLIKLKDTLNNTATLNGTIHHNLFDEISFENVKLETGKFAILNTTKTDNADFYGNVIGKATLNINGPINNTQIDIEGEPSILDTSHIYIPTSDSKESNKKDYIEFVQFGKLLENKTSFQNSNIICNLSIKANPSCKVDVILDEETGDIIKGQGEGTIKIRVGNIEPLSIRGTYKLSRGEYNFNFQTFLQKPFTLNSGGTISWNGDPYQANIDIYAEYLAKNVDISSLSTSGGFKQKEDIKIISHLTGNLQSPLVKFDLELPERSDAKRDDIIVKRLAEFKNDDNEMNKQVASLLLFNTFILGNQNFLTQGNASTLITNTIGGAISSLLTTLLNKELEKATKGILSTYIDINPTLDLQKSASQLQANIRAGLKILLSNKLVMLVGGNLDYNNTNFASQQLEKKGQRGLLTPDINIEWLLNKDGTIRIVGFNRSTVDLTQNQRNRSGLQLSYRKDVNKISDIFRKQKK